MVSLSKLSQEDQFNVSILSVFILLNDLLSNSCLNKATRFSYAVTQSSDKIKVILLNEYSAKHNGKLPICMES